MKYELDGVGMKKLAFQLIKRGDLIFFEGPVLSYFTDDNGNDYFMRWSEMDEHAHRWLLLQVTKEQMRKHLSGKISLLSLIKRTESGTVYFLDIDNDVEYRQIKCVEVGKIPEQYLPERDSYFDMKYGTTYARELETELKEFLKKQRHEQSFLETATINLFGKHSVGNMILLPHHGSNFNHDAGYLPEQYILALMDFPMLLHKHANKDNYLDHFFRPEVVPDAFSRVNSVLHGAIYGTGNLSSFSIDKLSREELSALVERILESVHTIVYEHPDKYMELYEEWKKVLTKNVNEIKIIDSVLQHKFAHETAG